MPGLIKNDKSIKEAARRLTATNFPDYLDLPDTTESRYDYLSADLSLLLEKKSR